MPDAQSGHEKTLTTLLPALAGSSILYGAGMTELGMSFSMEQLVIDNDIINMTREIRKGIPVDDITIAYEEIREVGSGGSFLSRMSTIENLDIQSNPRIINRQMYGDWEAAGSKDLADAAHEIVEDVMKNYEVMPIDADILKDLEAIRKRADEAFRAQL